MFTYHIHFEEIYCEIDPYKTDIYFQAKDIISLYELVARIKEVVHDMNDEESELYEEYSDYGWEEQINEAFDIVSDKYYNGIERTEVFTLNAEV